MTSPKKPLSIRVPGTHQGAHTNSENTAPQLVFDDSDQSEVSIDEAIAGSSPRSSLSPNAPNQITSLIPGKVLLIAPSSPEKHIDENPNRLPHQSSYHLSPRAMRKNTNRQIKSAPVSPRIHQPPFVLMSAAPKIFSTFSRQEQSGSSSNPFHIMRSTSPFQRSKNPMNYTIASAPTSRAGTPEATNARASLSSHASLFAAATNMLRDMNIAPEAKPNPAPRRRAWE